MYFKSAVSGLALLMLSVASPLSVQAQSIGVQLSDDVARFFYSTEIMGQRFGGLELETGLLYTDDSDHMLSVGAMVRGESVDMPIIVGVGGRLYYADIDPYTLGALAIGGDILISPASWKGFGIGASIFHAPSVTAFSDAEDFTEYNFTLNYQITAQANIYIGKQVIEADIDGIGDVELEDDTFVGIDMRF
jgi:hypothetical protein